MQSHCLIRGPTDLTFHSDNSCSVNGVTSSETWCVTPPIEGASRSGSACLNDSGSPTFKFSFEE
jgi:hypothetical protein